MTWVFWVDDGKGVDDVWLCPAAMARRLFFAVGETLVESEPLLG